jgi:hypothetical protein
MSDNDYAWVTQSVPTMTLREFYAGLAMQGMMSNDALLQRIGGGDLNAARFCVDWADALIAELKRGDSDE